MLARVDLKLAMAVTECIAILDEALAEHAASPDLSQQHAAIVESLDAAQPLSRVPLAPLRNPPMPLGAAPGIRTPAAPKPMPPRAPRKPTGPDKFDLEIPF